MASEVVVLAKVVALVVDVDGATGEVVADERLRGLSPADHAALAVGHRLARHHDVPVRVVSVGPSGDEGPLAQFAARVAGAATLVVVDDPGAAASGTASSVVAGLVAPECADALYVVAGEHSLDRGSASVPARVAEALGVPQALGVVAVNERTGEAVRRLSAGRRERLRLTTPMVISVEAGAGRPPRAAPDALLRDRVTVRRAVAPPVVPPHYAPYRVPAARVAAPTEPVAARRAMEVIGALAPARTRDVVVAEPASAARAILDRLHEWGYR